MQLDDDEKLICKLSYEFNVDVKRILFKIQNDRCRGETYSFKQIMPRPSQPLCVDFISANYSNNNYTFGFNYSIFTSKWDDEDGDNNDNDREDVAQCDQSQYSLTSFISVVNFTHNLWYEKYGFKGASLDIRAIKTSYKEMRQLKMTTFDDESFFTVLKPWK